MVQSAAGERIKVRIDRIGRFSNELDGRKIATVIVITENAGDWYSCR